MVGVEYVPRPDGEALSVLALSSRFDGLYRTDTGRYCKPFFQYSLCRVVLMVTNGPIRVIGNKHLSVLALSSRFDGPLLLVTAPGHMPSFQYSLCRVVLMVCWRLRLLLPPKYLSVLALSSRFDGLAFSWLVTFSSHSFSTRSVESF